MGILFQLLLRKQQNTKKLQSNSTWLHKKWESLNVWLLAQLLEMVGLSLNSKRGDMSRLVPGPLKLLWRTQRLCASFTESFSELDLMLCKPSHSMPVKTSLLTEETRLESN